MVYLLTQVMICLYICISTGIFRKYPSQTWYICILCHDNPHWEGTHCPPLFDELLEQSWTST